MHGLLAAMEAILNVGLGGWGGGGGGKGKGERAGRGVGIEMGKKVRGWEEEKEK